MAAVELPGPLRKGGGGANGEEEGQRRLLEAEKRREMEQKAQLAPKVTVDRTKSEPPPKQDGPEPDLGDDEGILSKNSLEDYIVERATGKGKFGVVYKAKRKADGLNVAIKKVQIFDMMDKKQRTKTLKEVKLLQSLDQPNIIRLLDAFLDENELIIVFEWAELGDLRKLLRKAVDRETPFDEGNIWSYFHQLAGAVKYMHDKRVMHRDIKPANIMITASGALKLGDLGLGREFSSKTMEAYSKVGTPLYMSPEVLEGKGYDWKSDVWSLGCVLYELAALRSPFKSDEKLSLYELFKKITKGVFPPLKDGYSPELRELVSRMVVTNPSQRINIDECVTISTIQQKKYQISPQQALRSESLKPKSVDESSNYILMEKLIEKLKVLNYDVSFLPKRRLKPLTPITFAVPDAKGQEKQFRYFIFLLDWLLSVSPVYKSVLTVDDPNAIVASFISEVRKFGIDKDLDMRPNKLRQGHGALVCTILNRASDFALHTAGFTWQQPVYYEDEEPEEDEDGLVDTVMIETMVGEEKKLPAQVGEDDKNGSKGGKVVDDQCEDSVRLDFSKGGGEVVVQEAKQNPADGFSMDDTALLREDDGHVFRDHSGRESVLDDPTPSRSLSPEFGRPGSSRNSLTRHKSTPASVQARKERDAEWRLSVERLLPQLRWSVEDAETARRAMGLSTWRTTLASVNDNLKQFTELLPYAKPTILKVVERSQKELEKIRSRECHIERACESSIDRYKIVKNSADTVQSEFEALELRIQNLTSELHEIRDEMEVLGDKQMGGDDDQSSHVITKMKESMKKVLLDIERMDLLIGTKQAHLNSLQRSSHDAKMKEREKKNAHMRRKAEKLELDGDDENSDDDQNDF